MSRFTIRETHPAQEDVFDRQRRISWWDQDRLRKARVMVVGTGAIGNEVLKNLALLGVGYVFCVDFDDISPSNLSRTVLFRTEDLGQPKAEVAARRFRELALEADAKVDHFNGDLVWELGAGLYRRMDLVLGCVDNIETRLAINRFCSLTNTPWIDAGIQELAGHVSAFEPPESACYQCTLSERQLERARLRYSCDNFKKKLHQEGRVPTVQIASALVAALQCQEAVKILCQRPTLVGKSILLQGTINDFDVIGLPRRNQCPAHLSYPEIEPVDLCVSDTLGDALERLGEARSEPVTLNLSADRSFVRRVRCRSCGQWIEIGRAEFRVYDSDTFCERCNTQEEKIHSLAENEPTGKELLSIYSLIETPREILDLELDTIGVAPFHVLPVQDAQSRLIYFEMSGDESRIIPGSLSRTETASEPKEKLS